MTALLIWYLVGVISVLVSAKILFRKLYREDWIWAFTVGGISGGFAFLIASMLVWEKFRERRKRP